MTKRQPRLSRPEVTGDSTGSPPVVYFEKRYEFPAAHFLQYCDVLHVNDDGVLITFRKARDPDQRVFTPRQSCIASTAVSKPKSLVAYALQSLIPKTTNPWRPHLPVTPIEDFPPNVAAATQSIERRLDDRAIKLAKSLRWRCNALGTAQVLQNIEIAQFCWSLDSRLWFPVYSWSRVEPIEWAYEYLDPVIEPENGTYSPLPEEPLAFELLMEARHLQYENPRAALVIGVAAAEIGTKRFLSSMNPGLRTLLASPECPSTIELLKNYYPKTSRYPITGGISLQLRKAAFERNRLAHAGSFSLGRDKLNQRLRAIEDLLRIFDIGLGFSWAEKFLTRQTRSALGLPPVSF